MSKLECVAERTVFAIGADGTRFEVRVAVGQPYREESGDWACSLAMDGLYDDLPDIHGVSSWQALILAIRLAKLFLGFFIQDGGKLYWAAGGEEISLNDIFFDEPMSREPEIPQADGQLTAEEQELVNGLTSEELGAVDKAIVANCSEQFQKVARVVGMVMELGVTGKPLPDLFYAQRVYRLVESGKLAAAGKIGSMRFCEVRLV